jgi:hypothetical protein
MPISLIRQHPHVPVFHTIILITVSLIVRFVHHSALIATAAALIVQLAITQIHTAITTHLIAHARMGTTTQISHNVRVSHLKYIFFKYKSYVVIQIKRRNGGGLQGLKVLL